MEPPKKQNHVGLVCGLRARVRQIIFSVSWLRALRAGCSWAASPVSLDVVCRPAVAQTDFAAWWSEISRRVVPSAPWRGATCKQPPTGAPANTSRRFRVLFVSRSSLEEAPQKKNPQKTPKQNKWSERAEAAVIMLERARGFTAEHLSLSYTDKPI